MRGLILLLTLVCGSAVAGPTITAPPTANAGSRVEITVTGATSGPHDYLTVAPKGSQQGFYDRTESAPGPGKYQVRVGPKAGDFEIWLVQREGRVTVARLPLKVLPVSATVAGPTQAPAGAEIEVKWTGPKYERDYIAVGKINPQEGIAVAYKSVSYGNPVKMLAPLEPGNYVIRYLLGDGNEPIAGAEQPITVTAVSATVTAPATVAAGVPMSVQWTGPNNPGDFLTIVKAGAPERTWGRDAKTANGNPSKFTSPDTPGEWEVRYLAGGNTLARARFTVGGISGSISAPAQVAAGETFKVSWKGPDSPRNFINVVDKGKGDGNYTGGFAWTDSRHNPATLVAPLTPGDYELIYSTSDRYQLARAALKVVASKQEPGKISVTQAPETKSRGAVELILDASGSMLQKLGPTRRIDIAKQTLTKLTSSTIPAGTPFALRVFGREVNSCQTDLDVPVSPLNPTAVGQRIAALTAKNGAKTPIGASLAKVAEDLKGIQGERLVVLITDGEETCDGDPATEIEKLRKAGIGTRVSIVGFALDDENLAATFRRWSDLGGGAFFDAKDAAGLEKSLNAALRPRFEVVNAQGQVIASGVVGGDAVDVPAGNHTVRMKDRANSGKPVTISPKQTATTTL
ncbi:MAG TPA: VWA domain-containing protein [Steroidobacteraceae bacterium]|nr:VWA domain-containing protein [Steroidobacteraceae bacterium]